MDQSLAYVFEDFTHVLDIADHLIEPLFVLTLITDGQFEVVLSGFGAKGDAINFRYFLYGFGGQFIVDEEESVVGEDALHHLLKGLILVSQ